MKAKDIEPGGTYLASDGDRLTYSPGAGAKVIVHEAPVERQRSSGRRDGARITAKTPTAGTFPAIKVGNAVVPLAWVKRPWTDEDEAALAERVEQAKRRRAFIAWADAYGLTVTVKGDEATVPVSQLARALRVLESEPGLADLMRQAVTVANGELRRGTLTRNDRRTIAVLDAMLDDRQRERDPAGDAPAVTPERHRDGDRDTPYEGGRISGQPVGTDEWPTPEEL